MILGDPFQIRERYLEGHFNKFHESNAKAVAKLKLIQQPGMVHADLRGCLHDTRFSRRSEFTPVPSHGSTFVT